MGSAISLFWGSPNDNVVDPATGLTGRQKKLVTNTWNIVRKDPVGNGVAIMIAYFIRYPEYQKQFPAFANMSIDELPENRKFQAHCRNIMTALNNAIDSINDPGLLVATLHMVGENHYKRGQMRNHFTDLKPVVLDVLREKFGAKFTPEIEEAMGKVIDAVNTVMFQKFKS